MSGAPEIVEAESPNGERDPAALIEDASGSVMERLRTAREEVLADDHLDLPVPGYPDGVLGIRYLPIPEEGWKQLFAKGKDVENIDGLIRACGSILYKENGAYEPITDKETGKSLRFEPALAEFLGFEAETAREVVRGVFCLDAHPLAVADHADRIVDWMRGIRVSADEGLLGE